MAVDVDDSLLPLDNSLGSPASEGAGELRALKAKLNNLFLSTGVSASFAGLIDTNNKGIHAIITEASATDLYSSRFKLSRTANAVAKNTYGVYAESELANNVSVTTGSINAFAAVTKIGTACVVGSVYSLNSIIYQQSHIFNGTLTSLYLVFANRLTSGVAAPSGLGSNQYNKNAVAITIDSFPRSSSGEYCGWKNGIVFTASSMDRDNVGLGYGIDFSAITYLGAGPWDAAYRMKSAIKMREYQAIIWSASDNIAQYMDPVTGRMVFTNALVPKFEIDMNTGAIYRAGVLVP
jgi:hypothetical protein